MRLSTLIFLILLTNQVFAQEDPAGAFWKVYKVYLYKQGDCTGEPQVIFENSNPNYEDFSSQPTLGSGAVENGTYHCVAIQLSDFIEVVPKNSTSLTACSSYNSANPLTQDICPSGTNKYDADSKQVSSCSSSNEKVWLFISTISTATGTSADPSGSNVFEPPTNSNSILGLALDGKLIVAKDQITYFKSDPSGRLQESGGNCIMYAPRFGFKLAQ